MGFAQKKPIVVEYLIFTTNIGEAYDFLGNGEYMTQPVKGSIGILNGPNTYTAYPGDVIIKHSDIDFHVVTREVFDTLYDVI